MTLVYLPKRALHLVLQLIGYYFESLSRQQVKIKGRKSRRKAACWRVRGSVQRSEVGDKWALYWLLLLSGAAHSCPSLGRYNPQCYYGFSASHVCELGLKKIKNLPSREGTHSQGRRRKELSRQETIQT